MFEIKEDQLNKVFFVKGKVENSKKFEHSKGKNSIVFPFATDTDKIDEAKPILKDFKSITATLHRNWLNNDISIPPSKEELIDELVEKVDSDLKYQLKDIIRKVLFNRHNSFVIFDKAVVPFVKRTEKNAKINNLIPFLFHLFDSEDFGTLIKQEFVKTPKSNILYNMVLEYLNEKSYELKSIEKESSYYDGKISKQHRDMFQRDYQLLLKNPDFFKDNVHNLVKYYYFSYILNLAIALNKTFNTNLNIKLFFSLDWEKLSQSRLAVDNGYKKLENIVSDLFSHANCIELLNMIDFSEFFPNQVVLYDDILKLYNTIEEKDILDLEASLHKIYKLYTSEISKLGTPKIDWEDPHVVNAIKLNESSDETQGLKIVRELFNALRFQFEISPRKSANKAYNQWYKEFVLQNYCKNRGRLGNTLSLNKENLLLFTELAILNQNADKILITTLWEELEARNINLDNQSKQEAIQYFQKINILEKKSDSGDAQYITKMYN